MLNQVKRAPCNKVVNCSIEILCSENLIQYDFIALNVMLCMTAQLEQKSNITRSAMRDGASKIISTAYASTP